MNELKKKNEHLKTFYNTDVIGNFKTELAKLGYISISSLLLTKTDRENLINEARKGHDNLGLNSNYPFVVSVSKKFYKEYTVKNTKLQGLLDIKIKSQDSKFIDELLDFLNEKNEVDFEIISYVGEKPSLTKKEKVNFLRSNVLDVKFSSRTTNCLQSAELEYVYQIYEFRFELYKIRNFGRNRLNEIREEFSKKGIDFYDIPKDLLEAAKRPFKKSE